MTPATIQELEAIRALFPVLEKELAELSDEELLRRFRQCESTYDAEPMDFFKYRLYALSDEQRGAYVTRCQYAAACKDANDPEAEALVVDKGSFARAFESVLGREVVVCRVGNAARFKALCKRFGEVVVKPSRGGYGRGIRLCDAKDADGLWRSCLLEDSLVEERIVQHPDLACFHAASVNCVRVATAVDRSGSTHILAATLRCGRRGNLTDSGDTMFAPIDVDTGLIVGDACDHFRNVYLVHPDSWMQFQGARVPHWKELLEAVDRLATLAPGIRLANWDWACRRDGTWSLIEGNVEGGFGPCQLALGRGLAMELRKALEWGREDAR